MGLDNALAILNEALSDSGFSMKERLRSESGERTLSGMTRKCALAEENATSRKEEKVRYISDVITHP
jgi:hypothetical protein